MGDVETYRLLILGDFHYGESYSRAGAVALKEHGYAHSTVRLRPFVDAVDCFIVNLETPLINPGDDSSPLAGKKSYIHWANPDATGAALKDLGVDAVSLANNHTLDQGKKGLESTFQTLSSLGIGWFGAGRTLKDAQAPFKVELPERVGGGEIHLHGSFQYSRKHDVDYDFYARADSSGCAPLKTADVPEARHHQPKNDSFQIAFPHWGANYSWRTTGQYRLAHRFLRKNYDLVLGHGGHALQEVHRKQQRWIIYGLGNGVFNSGGRWRRHEELNDILPFSLWAIVEVTKRGNQRSLVLKLYPVYSDNSATGFQPGPVSATDFDNAIEKLQSMPARPWRFGNPAQATGADDLGNFLSLDLGEWPVEAKPSRLVGSYAGRDAGDWPLRSPGVEVEDEVLRLDKFLGTAIPVLGAERNGGSAEWLSSRIALIEKGSKRFLVQSYRVLESSLGAAIVKDKVLAAGLLTASGVATPKTLSVSSVEAAIDALAEISGQVVIKPRDGRKSRGVSTGLVDQEEVREAFCQAQQYGREILVQQHIEVGEELRVMASKDRVVAINGRVLPHVVGDGVSTVKQLIEDKNLQRTLNPSLVHRPIPIDSLTLRQLERVGSSLEHVPSLGAKVTVRNVAGLSVGGDTNQVLETSEPAIKEAAQAAVAAIPGLAWGGVDLIIEKGTGKPFVIEINTEASYGAALFPAYGSPRDLAAEVWNIRYCETEQEVDISPGLPRRKRKPKSILAKSALQDMELVEFGTLFQESLERQGFMLSRKSQRVLIASHEGRNTWVTNSGLTASDKSAISSVIKNHQHVHKLMVKAEVPTLRTRTISSAKQLQSFVAGRVGQAVLAPNLAPWDSPKATVMTEQQVLGTKSLRGKKWVQARPRGLRLRVLATRYKAFAITSDMHQAGRVGRKPIEVASRLAVEAVRAIPELRWAAVDILVQTAAASRGRTDSAAVEGLTRAPRYSLSDVVLAGDIDEFCKEVLST